MIAGRGDRDPARAARHRRTDDAVVQPILVAPGRIAAFVLEPDWAVEADPAADARAFDQGGAALAERQVRRQRRQQRRPPREAGQRRLPKQIRGNLRVVVVDLQRILHARPAAGQRASAQQRRIERKQQTGVAERALPNGRRSYSSPSARPLVVDPADSHLSSSDRRHRSIQSFDLRPDLFGEHLHLVHQLGHAVGGEEQSEEMGHAGFAERIRPLDHGLDAADQIDVLRLGRAPGP